MFYSGYEKKQWWTWTKKYANDQEDKTWGVLHFLIFVPIHSSLDWVSPLPYNGSVHTYLIQNSQNEENQAHPREILNIIAQF